MSIEQREDRRRILRVRASVCIIDAIIEARTHDISEKGISVLLPFPPRVGTHAQINFSLFHEGKINTVSLTARVIHCTLSADFFRTGYSFINVPVEHQKTITAYCLER